MNTAIGSTHHRLDFLIGPGSALDCSRYYIIAIDALGNGLSSSPSNSAAQPESEFPRFTIRDMVEMQRRTLDGLGVEKLVAVVGASMGGMQALQWGVSHPDRMAGVVAITPMARTARWSQLVNEMSRRALFSDRECKVPRARQDAMRLWSPLTQLVMARTPEALDDIGTQEALSGWLDQNAGHQAEYRPDAFDWCYQSWAYDAHDVGTTPGFRGNTAGALGAIEASLLVLAPAFDLYNPAFAGRSICDMVPGGRFIELPGHDGHASASADSPEAAVVLRDAVSGFLRSLGA